MEVNLLCVVPRSESVNVWSLEVTPLREEVWESEPLLAKSPHVNLNISGEPLDMVFLLVNAKKKNYWIHYTYTPSSSTIVK